ncbi:MAG TPA: hypothetical protein VFU19_11795 [Iamia sp.]|nr:hypothetical protein [Iamia sp.]
MERPLRIPPFDWASIGDAAPLRDLVVHEGGWTLERQLKAWAQWVDELAMGSAPVVQELDAMYDCRDDLEDLLIAGDLDRLPEVLADYVDRVDAAYRDLTVAAGPGADAWWRDRRPWRFRQRGRLDRQSGGSPA